MGCRRPLCGPRVILCLTAVSLFLSGGMCGPEDPGFANFVSPQVDPIAMGEDGSHLYVANTTSGSIDVIDTTSHSVVATVAVGLDPVSVEVRPGGSEVWVSNHVSDTVSVIDVDPVSPTLHQVVHTIHDIDADGVTQFDEPTDIAFTEDGTKAYVALSSRNDVAVIDAESYAVTGRIHITAQDPRALRVRGDRLYVAVFESSNQSELSVCPDSRFDPPQCTMDIDDIVDFVLFSPNVPGSDTRIVIDPDVPDRDLYVFDTQDDSLFAQVSGVGTLLYGLTVSSTQEVFVSQTEARNAENGEDGENLIELDNRMFLNQIARVDCSVPGCGSPGVIELEPLPPSQPASGMELANPYGIQLSGDDSTLVVTAAMTSRLFTLDAASGTILDILDLNDGVPADFGQQLPRGVALHSNAAGVAETAYVLNSLENTVSVVDVSDASNLQHITKISIGSDPTPDAIRRGRIAFSNAFASSTGTFSCESCHPDGNTDQLLWRIGGACFLEGCTGDDEIRSTMPIRGLKNTLPLHWDGTLGDPIGGPNGAVGFFGNHHQDPPNCGDDHSCFLHLVDASLSGVMCDQTLDCSTQSELSGPERDDMAVFLASVSYPPARSRRMDDSLSPSAQRGFADFFVNQGGLGGSVTTCADMDSGCHALPLGVDTNARALAGFDAPTMRGMTDRFLQFSLGITHVEEVLEFANHPGELPFNIGGTIDLSFPGSPIPWDPDEGFEEDVTFAAAFAVFDPIYNVGPIDIFQMFEEASTGFSGALGRQVTLNPATTAPGSALTETEGLLAVLEAADKKGVVNLRGEGVRDTGLGFEPVTLAFSSDQYAGSGTALSREELLQEASQGSLLATFTAMLRRNVGAEAKYPQALLSVRFTSDGPDSNPNLPFMRDEPFKEPFIVRAADLRADASLFVDGQRVAGTLECLEGDFDPFCNGEVRVLLDETPEHDLRMLQAQNYAGPLSPELPFVVASPPPSPPLLFVYSHESNDEQFLLAIDPDTVAGAPLGIFAASSFSSRVGMHNIAFDGLSGVLYGIASTSDHSTTDFELATIDPATLEVTPVALVDYSDPLGLTFDTDQGILYGVETSSAGSRLFFFDPQTLETDYVGDLANDVSVSGLAYDENRDVLFWLQRFNNENRVVQIDKHTGVRTPLPESAPTGDFRELTYDSERDVLYMVRPNALNEWRLFEVNPTTGQGLKVDKVDIPRFSFGTITGLAYCPGPEPGDCY